MRKLTLIFIVVTLAVSANAGTIDIFASAVNGQPITPTKEITINPMDVVSMDVVWDPAPENWPWTMSFDITATGPAVLSDDMMGLSPCWGQPPVIILQPKVISISAVAQYVGCTSGIVVDSVLLYCEGPGDVNIKLLDNPNLPAGGTYEIDSMLNLYPASFGSGVIIHQVDPRPACWDCPGQPYGDTNGDGKVSAIDYFNFKKSYGICVPGPCPYNCCCDFNHDGEVNAMDYFVLKKNYGKSGLGTCSDTSCP